jgi:hypothetical protein
LSDKESKDTKQITYARKKGLKRMFTDFQGFLYLHFPVSFPVPHIGFWQGKRVEFFVFFKEGNKKFPFSSFHVINDQPSMSIARIFILVQ